MFRSSTIIRELALNPAKVTFTLKHLVKLRRYLLRGCVAACHGMACVFHAQHDVASGRQHRGSIIPQAVTHSLVLLKMDKIISRNMLS